MQRSCRGDEATCGVFATSLVGVWEGEHTACRALHVTFMHNMPAWLQLVFDMKLACSSCSITTAGRLGVLIP